MDFEELHGKNGSGTTVGVDLTTLMTSQVAVSTAAESGGDGGRSYGSDMTVPRISSFQVYWDVQGKQFKVFNPKVVDPGGNEITVTETPLSRGTYVCEVKKNATTGKYTAAIKLSSGVVPGNDTVTVVKLFAIADGKVEQYHVGAIILGNGQITGEEGKTRGSKAVGVSGEIDAKGETGSGLVMKTYKTGKKNTLSVDLSGRKQTDSFEIKEVKDGDGKVVAKILATEGFDIPGGSSDDTVNVFTGAEIEVDVSSQKLTIKFTTKKITVLKVEDVSETTDAELDLEQCDVVESSSYDTGTHEFQNTLQGLVVFGHTSPQAASPDTVFQAQEHSTEE